jgi:hypothetical protein
LLNKYILSFNSSGLEFKVYLNEELTRIKENLTDLQKSNEFRQDRDMLKKLAEIEDVVGRFQTKKVDTNMIEKVMSIQNLVAECNS